MSLLDDEDIFLVNNAEIVHNLNFCKEWISNHLPMGFKGLNDLFISDEEYELIQGPNLPHLHYDIPHNQMRACNILIKGYENSETNKDKFLFVALPKMYIGYQNSKLIFKLIDNYYDSILVLENVEDMPEIITNLLFPYMSQPTPRDKLMNETVAGSRWAYMKGRVLFNYSKPELMYPHNTVYVKYEF